MTEVLTRRLQEQDWPAVVRIQSLAYDQVLLESETALRAKQILGPESCLVLEVAGSVRAYCLSHPWSAVQAPSLHSTQTGAINSDNLFIHDMALDPAATGQGLARRLFEGIERAAVGIGCRSISLVAVQNSAPFWSRLGFSAGDVALPDSYGDGAIFMVRPLDFSPKNAP